MRRTRLDLVRCQEDSEHGWVMRAAFGAMVVAYFIAAPHASAEEVVLSCAVEESGPNHARRLWELRFDQKNQLVYIAKTMSTAAITDSKITFRVDLGNGVPLSFAIDRSTGFIRVTGSSGSLYTGQCKTVDPLRRT
jgi:hypothetical protein